MNSNLRRKIIIMSQVTLVIYLQFFLCSLLFANSTSAQRMKDIYVTVSFSEASIDEVFESLKRETGFNFLYNDSKIRRIEGISFQANNESLEEVLKSLSITSELQFRRVNNTISVKRYEAQELVPRIEETLAIDVSGKVTDENGDGLPGATIQEKGTTNGTITDVDGNFTLNVSENAILTVSFVGYETQEIPLNGRSNLSVKMGLDAEQLEEVVVVGYGTQKRADLTGSISSISSEDLQQVQVLSPDHSLQGRVAGVSVTQTSGQPGATNRIRIRGGNSISAGNEPLYVIDGFPIYNNNNSSNTNAARSPNLNALATINPGDIESIEVLKDASATAIYGSRGANGVILITTKRGSSGRNNISFEGSYGIQNVRQTIPMLNAAEFAAFENEIFLYQRDILGQSNRVPVYTDEQIASLGEGTNWQDELFRSAPIQNYQLSFTGGDADTKYSIIGGYTDQQGIILNSDFKRYSLRVNLDKTINTRIRIGNSSSINRTTSNLAFTGAAGGIQGSGSGVVGVAMHFNPIVPVHDPNTGEYSFDDLNVGEYPGAVNRSVPFYNPVALAELATNVSQSLRSLNSVFGEVDLMENLTFRTSLGADFMTTKQKSYMPASTKFAAAVGGSARIGQVETFTWLNENTLNYRYLSGKHNLNFLIGYTAQSSRTERFEVNDAGFVNDVLAENNIGTGNINANPVPPGVSEWGLLSYLARANYIFSERYLFTLTARYDGSSRFGKDNKWGFFPSAAFAWRLSEEGFIQSVDAISLLKLRSSYGLTGNQEIGIYQSLAQMSSSIYTIGGSSVAGFSSTRIANPNLKWETTSQFDLGFDLGLFNNRLSIVADYYLKKTEDLLLSVQIPSTSGFTSSLQNIGGVKNEGFELSINTIILEGDFNWDFSVNWATNKNTVTDLGDEDQRLIYSGWNVLKGAPASLLEVGQPIGNFVGWKTNGWFLTDAEAAAAPDQTPADQNPRQLGGNIRYVDINDDGVVDDDDRTTIGNALPKWTGGFSSSFSFGGLSLSTIWTFSVGNDIMNFNKIENHFGIGRYNASKNFANRWSYMNSEEENLNATAPTVLDSRNLFSVIDYWVEDASYLRMRNITLSYDFPLSKMKLPFIQSAQVYVSGQNLITFTEYSGFDPEVNLGEQDNLLLGYDYGAYPAAKSYTLGFRFNF